MYGLLLIIRDKRLIRALEQSTMVALTLFASQSKLLDLKDILGLYCGIKVVIQCHIVDFTLSQYIVIYHNTTLFIAAIHFLVAIPKYYTN